MRIIAGEFRGRKLLGPDSSVTRPITDRAKQSLFDILAPKISGAVVYDCFAGTGSMGLECLSRGAGQVMFFEADRPAAARLRRNIDAVQVGSRSQVITEDLFRWFERAAVRTPADLIFLDPPYRFLTERPEVLRQLAGRLTGATSPSGDGLNEGEGKGGLPAAGHLAPDGVVIFRHDSADALTLPGLQAYDERRYGSMDIEFLRRRPLTASDQGLTINR